MPSSLQESEIAEVLYKQDVDLGFSLDQEQIINASYASGNSAASQAKARLEEEAKSSDPSLGPESTEDALKDTAAETTELSGATVDDIEKLKALEELQQDKVARHLHMEFHNIYPSRDKGPRP